MELLSVRKTGLCNLGSCLGQVLVGQFVVERAVKVADGFVVDDPS